MRTSQKPRIAWFSPLNLTKKSDSIAAYTSELVLPFLLQDFSIDLYTDQNIPGSARDSGQQSYQGCNLYHYLSCYKQHVKDPYDLIFYQYEDTKLANFVRLHLGLIPGITLFHDLLIRQELPAPLTFSPWPDILTLFKNPQYDWPARYPQPDRGPFAYREVALSPISLYSAPRLCGEARRHLPEPIGQAQSWLYPKMLYMPLPVANQPGAPSKKSELKIVAYCGSTAIEHRAHKVLSALREIKGLKLNWLIDQEEELQAIQLLSHHGVKDYQLYFGRNPEHWSKIVKEAGIALHTLFSVYGSLGPYLPISMLQEALVLVTDFAEGEALSDSVVFKIEPGEKETQKILATINTILDLSSGEQQLIRATAKAYALENHNAELVSSELRRIFHASIPFFKKFWRRWNEIEGSARNEIIKANTEAGDVSLIMTFVELGWSSDL